jgi:type IV pilus assembly protein PilW
MIIFPRTVPTRAHGFSLVELMISITIALILTAGIGYVIMSTSHTRKELDRMNRQIENGRFAMQVLTDDLSQAGFYGRLYDIPAAPSALPDPCLIGTADLYDALPLQIQGYNDPTTSPLTCITGHKAGTDILVVRRASAVEVDIDDITDNKRVYLQTGALSYKVELGENSANFTLQQKNHVDLIPARAYLVHIYWVNTSDQLMVKELDATSSSTILSNAIPIADGIEDLQLDYGIDSTGPDLDDSHAGADPDGTPDTYSECGACTTTDWQNVAAVRINLIARNPEKTTGYSDSGKTYMMGVKGETDISLPAGYRRHVYQSLVRLSNIGGRREL